MSLSAITPTTQTAARRRPLYRLRLKLAQLWSFATTIPDGEYSADLAQDIAAHAAMPGEMAACAATRLLLAREGRA